MKKLKKPESWAVYEQRLNFLSKVLERDPRELAERLTELANRYAPPMPKPSRRPVS